MVDGGPARVLVIAPAYNEAGAIARVVCDVRAALPRADFVVVDDGSRDATAECARAAGARVVRHPLNLGIGAAVQTGLKVACREGYDRVVRVDGDGQHDAAQIPALLATLEEAGADAAFGSRFLPDGPWRATRRAPDAPGMAIPPLRRLGIITFAALATALTGQRCTDATSGFACYNRRAAAVLAAQMPQDYPEVESRIVLHRAGCRVVELPVRMRPRVDGRTSITSGRSVYYAFKVSVAVLMTVLKDVKELRIRN